uniref:Uncharacterized protein n=1 Tax=Acrobeloides nanus TaxID=290746 RepID=A0A914D714_9BILA
MSKGDVMELIERKTPRMIIDKEKIDSKKGVITLEGRFLSPLYEHCPEIFASQNVGTAYWRGYFPTLDRQRNGLVIHLGGTGDHGYVRREYFFVNELLKHGISSILLQTPFYGNRKPVHQFRSSLHNVSDLFVMGASIMSECCFLLKWASEQGHFPLGLSGVSMGGYMANLSATNAPFPVSLIPCLSSTTAAPNYTQGAISEMIEWKELEKDINSTNFWEGIKCISDCDWYDRYNTAISMKNQRNFSKAQELMWLLMEEFTNLKMYPLPKATNLVKAVNAETDAYVLRDGIPDFPDIWPGANVMVIPEYGHVHAYLLSNHIFRSAILEMMQGESESISSNLDVNVIRTRSN